MFGLTIKINIVAVMGLLILMIMLVVTEVVEFMMMGFRVSISYCNACTVFDLIIRIIIVMQHRHDDYDHQENEDIDLSGGDDIDDHVGGD